ncbi:MAG: FHA domain-containing protein, partial [Planctomycetes bacterium]|nr:FHA domain-containing protein [Planctomycetota bacterium]
MSQCLLLEVIQGPLTGETFAVVSNSTLQVGRLPECGISIPQDLTVSRQHFRIEFFPPDCQLIHLSQTGETFVNDIPV